MRSQRAGDRVYTSIKKFLETRLKLKVNDHKSMVAPVKERKFLGYRILNDGMLTVSPASLQQAKDKIRQLTGRNRGRSFGQVITELNQYLIGWLNYFRLAETKSLWSKLDGWIRRKLRCYRLKQCKTSSGIARLLRSRGMPKVTAHQVGCSAKQWWYLSKSRTVQQALSNAWFKSQGLCNLKERKAKLLTT